MDVSGCESFASSRSSVGLETMMMDNNKIAGKSNIIIHNYVYTFTMPTNTCYSIYMYLVEIELGVKVVTHHGRMWDLKL